MNQTSNFASLRFRLVIGGLAHILLLTALPLTAMVRATPANVNTPNALNATYSLSRLSAYARTQSDKPHTMAATYYSLKGNLKASINLNNKGLAPLEVKPTVFNLAGERLDVPPVTVDGNTFQVFDLAEWAGPGGPSFEQGSLQLFYRGKDMLLGAQIKIVDSASSLIFDEQLGEPTSMYSSRLEGLWSRPTDSQVSIAISNTTDSIQVASLDLHGIEPKQQGSKEMVFQPHQTALIDLAGDLSDRPAGVVETGGISINHSGKPGSLIARVMIQNPLTGFSSALQFADPGKARSSRLHGAGIRLGTIAGEGLTPVVIARNISDRMAVVHGRIRYTKGNGSSGERSLGKIELRPGEMRAWEISGLGTPPSIGTEYAGLEIDYDTEPGSVVVSALSVSGSGNHVFHVPMLDAAAQRSSTGAYPFYMYGTSSTIVYIKNTTAVEQKYLVYLNYEGGNYRRRLKTIAPGETVSIDIRALRDSQVLDDEGRTIRLDVTHGQVRWTLIQSKGTDPLALIGRAEQVDQVKAISSTYACQNCCGDFFSGVEISPAPEEMQVGQSVTVRAFEIRAECYGETYQVEQTASWNSSNPLVATVPDGQVSNAQVTAIGSGQTTITATWSSQSSVPAQCGGSGFIPGPIGGCCNPNSFVRSASVTVTVQTVEIGSTSPETMNVSTGDVASAHPLAVHFTPANSSLTISFRITFLHNFGGTQPAGLAVPSRTGTSPISTTVKASPDGRSGAFVVQPALGTTVSPTESRVIVPPQVLLQMMRNEARGLSSTSVRSLLGWSLRNRFGDSQFFAGQTTYLAAITAGATRDTTLINGGQPELDAAASVFDGFFDASSECQGFWSPRTTQWTTVTAALNSRTTTLPTNVGIPFNYNGNNSITQIVYFSSVGLNTRVGFENAPAFLFVRKRSADQPAVVKLD